jgi:DNA replication and repair protein RecF
VLLSRRRQWLYLRGNADSGIKPAMNIQRLLLSNFRNFQKADIEFPPNALLVAASPNATGKTNFLESIVMLLRGRSFRAPTGECVAWGEAGFHLQGIIERNEGVTNLAVAYDRASRRLRVEENQVPASPVTFYAHYPLVLFLPEDTFMFNRGPAARRNFLNRVLISSGPYVAALVQYQRALLQRNTALRGAALFAEVEAWTQLLVKHGEVVHQQRQGFVEFLATHLADMYELISGESRPFTVSLSGSALTGEAALAHYEATFPQEQQRGFTLSGPHREDVTITSRGHSLAAVLSQGQLRSVVIALKLVAHNFIHQITEETPLLLLDEVLSELDEDRQTALLRHLPPAQTLLTCTTVPAVLQGESRVQVLDLRTIHNVSPVAAAV